MIIQVTARCEYSIDAHAAGWNIWQARRRTGAEGRGHRIYLYGAGLANISDYPADGYGFILVPIMIRLCSITFCAEINAALCPPSLKLTYDHDQAEKRPKKSFVAVSQPAAWLRECVSA